MRPTPGGTLEALCVPGIRNRCAAGTADIKAAPADIEVSPMSGQCRSDGKHDTGQHDEQTRQCQSLFYVVFHVFTP